VEAYELTTGGGATDFARLIAACESFGPYCLIGGLAVNCYVEPVYTLDASLVVIASSLPKLAAHLQAQGFKTEEHAHSLNALPPGSDLRIQFTTDERYQAFLARFVDAIVLGGRRGSRALRTSPAVSSGRTSIRGGVYANARRTNWT